MSVKMIALKSREEWQQHRTKYIGGSDAAAAIGANPYMSNVDLWEIKTGIKEAKDISQEPFVKYGTLAEYHLRELFRLDFPEYVVSYIPNNSFLNERYSWAAVSLDGWLKDDKGRQGVLEIKTTNILKAGQREKWDNAIPQNYYIQLLHALMVTEFDFAVLKAQLRYHEGIDTLHVTKHYRIERHEVQADIDYLTEREATFADFVKTGKRPPLILPSL